MSTDVDRETLLRPMAQTTTRYYLLAAACLVATAVFVVAYGYQLSQGMIVTNLSDWGSGGGVTWGLYIGAFIWWVGIAHGGIILSAAVRLLNMDRFSPVARLAELLTIGALMMAGLYIVVHVGRPDRVVTSVLGAYTSTVHTSPLIWDVTVITLYFVMTATYLALTIRYDLYRLRDRLPDRFDRLYELLLFDYSPEEDEVVERLVWWLALGIIILAPLLLHGGVIPWLFALIPSMPGWYGAVQGPQFLTIALSSAISGVLIVALSFRLAYGWEELIPDEVFRGLAKWLAFFALLFLWLQLQQIITGVYHPTTDVDAATAAKLGSPVYWLAIGAVIAALAYLAASAIDPELFSIPATIAAAVAMLLGTLVEKVFFVIEGLMYPTFSIYEASPGTYVPSLVELTSVLGTVAMVVLFFMIVSKVIPVVELHVVEEHHGVPTHEHASHDHATDGGTEVSDE